VVGQTGSLPLDVELVQGRQDAELVVQGEEFVEGAAGGGGGQVGALALT
jgi:hypothetical protein